MQLLSSFSFSGALTLFIIETKSFHPFLTYFDKVPVEFGQEARLVGLFSLSCAAALKLQQPVKLTQFLADSLYLSLSLYIDGGTECR